MIFPHRFTNIIVSNQYQEINSIKEPFICSLSNVWNVFYTEMLDSGHSDKLEEK